jgi:hypothetical protein
VLKRGRGKAEEEPRKRCRQARRKRGASEKIRQREKGSTEKKKDWNSPRTYT